MSINKLLTGQEHLTNSPLVSANDKVLNFWQWAFGDLRSNDIRGILAEWLVALLLNLPLTVRNSWGEYDLETETGIKIEVKTSAYLQTWQQVRDSKIKFTGLSGRKLNKETNQYAGTETYNADLYVFCCHIEQNNQKWDALDLSQWRFYLLTQEQLVNRNTKSISLGVLKTITHELTAEEFCEKGKTAIEFIQMSKLSLQGIWGDTNFKDIDDLEGEIKEAKKHLDDNILNRKI